jgi:protease PrsW
MSRLRFVTRFWFLTFVSGGALFFISEKVLAYTENPNYFPTVIMLGAFLIPVTFVIYIYEREDAWEISPALVAVTFLWGGAVGVLVAGFLEYDTLRELKVFPALLGVGFIEESAKLVLPVALFLTGRYRREADGLVFGAASGMGFAALETMGYGFVALIASQGNVGVLEDTLLIRGFLAPIGHGTWTGFVCAVLWRERERGGSTLRISSVAGGAFLIVVVLHAAWDSSASLEGPTLVESLGLELLTLAVALVSLVLFIRIVREAGRAGAAAIA